MNVQRIITQKPPGITKPEIADAFVTSVMLQVQSRGFRGVMSGVSYVSVSCVGEVGSLFVASQESKKKEVA